MLQNGNGRRQKIFLSLKISRMSHLRSLVYTVTSVLDNRSGTSVQVQVHWYVRLKAERITTSAEQILSLIFTEHFFLQIYQIYSSEKMFCENCFIQFVLQRPLQRCSHSVTGHLAMCPALPWPPTTAADDQPSPVSFSPPPLPSTETPTSIPAIPAVSRPANNTSTSMYFASPAVTKIGKQSIWIDGWLYVVKVVRKNWTRWRSFLKLNSIDMHHNLQPPP